MDIQADNIIDQGDIAQTERLIRPPIRRTPVIQVDAADFGLTAARLSFKLELFSMQARLRRGVPLQTC